MTRSKDTSSNTSERRVLANAEIPHRLQLKAGADARLAGGHPWVYRNELKEWPEVVQPGDLVDLEDSRGRFIGRGYLNPRSTIAVRLLAHGRVPIDQDFFIGRLRQAQTFREQVRGESATRSAYRVVHGEADGLPGLIVDRYGDAVVMQVLTAGMERRRDLILTAVDEVLNPATVVARDDAPVREREGLRRDRRVLRGETSAQALVVINDLEVSVDLLEGQKTGLYLDQFDNYPLLKPIAPKAQVLDCFCYVGLWGLHAARYGAARVIGVDQSARAIAAAQTMAERNGMAERCAFEIRNVFDDLRERDRRRETFDLVILDPPAFVKTRLRLAEALRGYKEINLRAMRLLRPGGFLLSCSCSHHLAADQFQDVLREAAHDARRTFKVIARAGQGPDHPVLLSLPESDYLKCFLLQAC